MSSPRTAFQECREQFDQLQFILDTSFRSSLLTREEWELFFNSLSENNVMIFDNEDKFDTSMLFLSLVDTIHKSLKMFSANYEKDDHVSLQAFYYYFLPEYSPKLSSYSRTLTDLIGYIQKTALNNDHELIANLTNFISGVKHKLAILHEDKDVQMNQRAEANDVVAPLTKFTEKQVYAKSTERLDIVDEHSMKLFLKIKRLSEVPHFAKKDKIIALMKTAKDIIRVNEKPENKYHLLLGLLVNTLSQTSQKMHTLWGKPSTLRKAILSLLEEELMNATKNRFEEKDSSPMSLKQTLNKEIVTINQILAHDTSKETKAVLHNINFKKAFKTSIIQELPDEEKLLSSRKQP